MSLLETEPAIVMKTQTHTSVGLLCARVNVKSPNRAAAGHSSIVKTGQPFKQLSVTVTHGNPKTCPPFTLFLLLTFPPPESHWQRKWKRGCNFSLGALTKVHPVSRFKRLIIQHHRGFVSGQASGNALSVTIWTISFLNQTCR